MRTYSLMFFVICLNLAAFILNVSGVFPVSQQLVISPTDITNQFSLTIFAGIGVGGAVIGIIALLTRTYVYAATALLIWIIGILLPIVNWVVNGVPMMLNMLLPSELWYISTAVQALIMVIFFMFFVEIATQRQIT